MTKGNKAPNRFLLLYGSQTGQAKAIAEQIFEASLNSGLRPDLYCLSLTERKFNIERENCAVFIVSTTGEGEPPDTAKKIYRRLNKRTLPNNHLKGLRYAMLALGDSNYNRFCNFGKALDKRIEELGGVHFYNTGFADDALGLEEFVEPWIEGLLAAVRQLLGLPAINYISEEIIYQEILPSKVTEFGDTFASDLGRSAYSDKYDNLIILESNAKEQSKSKGKMNGDSNNLEPSLTTSSPTLSSAILRLPLIPQRFISINYFPNESVDVATLSIQNGHPFPLEDSPLLNASVKSARKLTHASAVKTAIEMTIDITDIGLKFEPGDAFGFVCKNNPREVDLLLNRLDASDVADQCCRLSFKSNLNKPQTSARLHLPTCATLRHILSTCYDIRAVPKKTFLRCLAEYSSISAEKRRLLELSSREGAPHYMKFIREPNLNLLDILMAFPSSKPPVDLVLEHLPRLQPRFYSVASSPIKNPNEFSIVFNVVEIPKGEGRYEDRLGICTGWFKQIAEEIGRDASKFKEEESSLNEQMKKLFLDVRYEVLIYKRTNDHFILPKDLSVPVIMVGPGTGVAPFVGFLQNRECQIEARPSETIGETWLFFGCRHKDLDFLYREELEGLQERGILTKLLVSFSRDSPEECSTPVRYVQEYIKKYAADVVRLLDDGGKIYVCGDAKNMSKDVFAAFASAYEHVRGCSTEEAANFMHKLQDEKRYQHDVWM